MGIRTKLSRIKLLFSDLKPILLSHHPNCDYFKKHVYHIGKYKLCIGCFTFYPTILITFIMTYLLLDLTLLNLFILFFISIIFFSPIILNILGLTNHKIIKIVGKILNGIGVGFYLVSVIYLPFFFIFKIIAIFPISVFIIAIAYMRSRSIEKQCELCEYNGDWSSCPAMREITHNLVEHGFKKQKQNTSEIIN